MNLPKASALVALSITVASCTAWRVPIFAQISSEVPTQMSVPSTSLDLTPETASRLRTALAGHDYASAEKTLLEQIGQDFHSLRSASLLAYLGSVYYLNHDYLNAAIAWKKSDAASPLDFRLKFSLAMAYIQIGHADWARSLLDSLAARHQENALYPYWLGRLAYDERRYPEAATHLQKAIILDPEFARAYDSLGLCYFYQNENLLAVETFKRAISLDRDSLHPSPWPFLNLAEVLELLNRPEDAKANIRQAISLDPKLAVAHYRLAKLLELQHHSEPAISELREAIKIDARYAEPHISLAQIYRRLGRTEDAAHEVQAYKLMRPDSIDTKQKETP